MRIATASIHNFRSLESIQIRPGNVSCVTGPAAVGKSSVLDAISLCLDPATDNSSLREFDFFRPMEKPRAPSDYETISIHEGQQSFDLGLLPTSADDAEQIEIEVVLRDLPADLIREWMERLEVWADGTLHETAEDPAQFNGEGEWALRIALWATWDPEAQEAEVVSFFPKLSDPKAEEFDICRSRDRRRLPTVFLRVPRSPTRFLNLSSRGLVGRRLRGMGASIPNLSHKITEGLETVSEVLRQHKDLSQILKDFSAGLSGAGASSIYEGPILADPQIIGIDTRDILRSADIILQSTGHPDIPLSSESDSLRQLALITLLLTTADTWEVLILDSPELGLPPLLQKAVVRYLAAKRKQLIIGTSSPDVLATTGPYSVIRLCREEGATVAKTPFFPDAERKDIERLGRDFRNDIARALTAPWSLVVEGPSDREAWNSISEWAYTADLQGLEGLGFEVVRGEGDNIGRMVKILSRFGVKVCVTIDGDKDDIFIQNLLDRGAHAVLVLPEKVALEHWLVRMHSETSLKALAVALNERAGETLVNTFLEDCEALRASLRQVVIKHKGTGAYHDLVVSSLMDGVGEDEKRDITPISTALKTLAGIAEGRLSGVQRLPG